MVVRPGRSGVSDPQTLFDKVWDAHVVVPERDGGPTVLYVDLHLIHEVTSPQAFTSLAERDLSVRRPERTIATMDHATPTTQPVDGAWPDMSEAAALQVATLVEHCGRHGIELHGTESDHRGIVHVMGPELGATQPGMTIVCGDSHTSTHGAFGAFAFGIGTTEVAHVLATQCLLQKKPANMSIELVGDRPPGVSAKDMILAVIGQIGVDGGTGHVIEYRGQAVRDLDMEGRMTLCNMSIEAGARAGLIAPDETTFEYLRSRPKVPQGQAWDIAVARWRELVSDEGAHFDRSLTVDVGALEPFITWGTNPGMVVPITGRVPAKSDDPAFAEALAYMDLRSEEPLLGRRIDVAFVGSCTNGRLGDLREAAALLRGQRIAESVRMFVVPGSLETMRRAEAEGLDEVFRSAGAQWRAPGCSMCIAMNGDIVAAEQSAVSTSNRNFKGRQGKGSRSFLASPATVAASALAGCIADPRECVIAGEGVHG